MQSQPQRNQQQQIMQNHHRQLQYQQQQQQHPQDQQLHGPIGGNKQSGARNFGGPSSGDGGSDLPSLSQFTQGFTISGFNDGSLASSVSSASSSMTSSSYAPTSLSSSVGVGGNQSFTSGNSNIGLESLESLASLSVLSPSLPTPGEGPEGGRRHSVAGDIHGNNNNNSSSSGGYFSSSFQPTPSLPAIYQNQATGSNLGNNSSSGNSNNSNGGGENANDYHGHNASFQGAYYQTSQELFSGFQGHGQGQRKNSYQQQQQQQQLRQLPSYSISSSVSPLSSSLPAHSNFQQYSQQPQQHRPHITSSSSNLFQNTSHPMQQQQQQQQQQQHYSQDLSFPHQSPQSASSASSFSREARPRSRSQSLSITATSNTTGNTLTSIIPSSPSTKKAVVIPARPRSIPPRPPQVSAPRKYHGRQPRKAPVPTIDHQQVSGLREFVPPARRMAHILSEQKRREKINSGFEELKSVIPECAQNTDSKASILRKAVDRILELEDELRKYTDEFHYVPEDSVEREE